ncbi:uncharacterized protein LOC106056041 [Biomphalaria glabrata]|uniref:Uncharacterized protein LOC106056041 n=1 Tax=Biomphalaria glabrata TaxID=6526 RepID=A0A9W2ZCQ6_BIOGL|nr:uncharacterized protein LOC106056041 [Biomphalaria glabrata]
MQVVILIQACWSNTVAMCTVIPTHLFLVSYTWRLPNGYSNHTLVVILLKESSDMVRNFDLDGNFFDEGSHYIAVSTGVTIISYTLSKRKNYFLSSASNSPIGCYIYGEHQTTSYATPLHFKFNFPKYVSTSTTNTGHWCTPSSTIAGDNTDNDCDGYIDEEIDNQKDDDNDTKIDEDIAASTDTGCLPGWFGTKCDKLCHCNNSQCLMNGNCKENVTCLPGFFGLQCQYKDVIMSAEVNRQEMKFRHFVKCFNNFTVKDPLNIIFPSSERISSIQIEAVSKDDLLDLQLYFLQIPNISCFVGPCLNRRDIYVDRNTLIVMCNISSNICMVSISFKGLPKPRRLCAVYVNAGRNVAPGSQVTMSSYYNDTFGRVSRGSLSVDGESLSCSTSAVNDSNPVWKMSFLNAMRIDEILINFGDTSPEETFILKFYDDKGNTINKWTGRAGKMVSVIIRNRFAVFSIEAVLSQGVLSICEVETYGECAPPTYGPDCSDICSISCPDMICTYEGYCRTCHDGTGGPYCFEGCIDWCGDYQEMTNATTTAVISNWSYIPYHYHSGFGLENFWYYFMVSLVLLTVVCLSAVDLKKTHLIRKERGDKVEQETPVQKQENVTSDETIVRRQSMDVSVKSENAKSHETIVQRYSVDVTVKSGNVTQSVTTVSSKTESIIE